MLVSFISQRFFISDSAKQCRVNVNSLKCELYLPFCMQIAKTEKKDVLSVQVESWTGMDYGVGGAATSASGTAPEYNSR